MRPGTVGLSRVLRGVVLLSWLPAAALGQPTTPARPPLVIASTYGPDLFEFYCASCHGRDGRGRGPVAASLKNPPPDLTTLARRNSGTFPRGLIESFVTGDADRPAPAHGVKEMPVWGPIFRGLDSNDSLNKVRIANIVGHIESMQVK